MFKQRVLVHFKHYGGGGGYVISSLHMPLRMTKNGSQYAQALYKHTAV